MEMLLSQSWYFQLKSGTPVFWGRFSFFRKFISISLLKEPLLSVGFKIKPVRKRFSCVKTKTNSNFALKPAERSNRPFSDYLMNHLFQTPVLFNM